MTDWRNTPQAKRHRKQKIFTLSERLIARLHVLQVDGANISAIAEDALRAHPKVNMPTEHEEVPR